MVKSNKCIAIIAPTGMLGSGVYNVLKSRYDLVLVYRNKDKIKKLDEVYGGVNNHQLVKLDIREIYNDYLQGQCFSQSPKLKNYLKILEK